MERPLLILDTASDERLVALACTGDERAFAAIVARYREPLRRHCRRFLNPASADDALQQAFINAHAALIDGNAPYALKPWLYRIARNAALISPACRRSSRSPTSARARRSLHDVIDRRETFDRMVGAVRALPASQRSVIVRHAIDGESHERIAADLGLSTGAIRQWPTAPAAPCAKPPDGLRESEPSDAGEPPGSAATVLGPCRTCSALPSH